ERAETLSGRVTSAAGAPVAGATVTVLSGERLGADPDTTPVARTVTTGGDGSFRSVEAAADGNRVTVVARGYGAATLANVRAGAAPDGRYEVRGLLPQRPYRLRADDPRHAPFVRERILLATAETVQADVPLWPAATLSGRVVDQGGRPVAGALGRLFAPPGRGV